MGTIGGGIYEVVNQSVRPMSKKDMISYLLSKGLSRGFIIKKSKRNLDYYVNLFIKL